LVSSAHPQPEQLPVNLWDCGVWYLQSCTFCVCILLICGICNTVWMLSALCRLKCVYLRGVCVFGFHVSEPISPVET
jgi:hypothetical protein